MRVEIPSTIEEAKTALNGLGRLLTATEWERAAIVAAFVEPGVDPVKERGKPRSARSGAGALTAEKFAALGIVGLRNGGEVSRYFYAWKDESGRAMPKPGDVIETLPTKAFPKITRSPAQRKSDAERFLEEASVEEKLEVLIEAIEEDPKLEAALEEYFGEDEEEEEEATGKTLEPELNVPAANLRRAFEYVREVVEYLQEGRVTPRDRSGLPPLARRMKAGAEVIIETAEENRPVDTDWDAAFAEELA